MKEEGYLYTAFGDKFIDEARVSARSLRKVDPEANITLITDKSLDSTEEFDHVQLLEEQVTWENRSGKRWKKGLGARIKAMQQTPYQKTFFIDTDTYFCDNCRELFRLLDYFDLLIAMAPTELGVPVLTNGEQLDGCYSYNCGVIIYNKSDKILSFFEQWLACFQEHFDIYMYDQQAFTEALLYAPIKTFTLHNIYNLRTHRICAIAPKNVKIIHGRPDDYEDMERRLNRITDHRVWIPRKNKVIPWAWFRHTFLYRLYEMLPDSIKNLYRSTKGRA